MIAVDILADKLKDQKLEECAKTKGKSPITFIQPGEGFKLSKNAEAAIKGSGKKVWTVKLNSGDRISGLTKTEPHSIRKKSDESHHRTDGRRSYHEDILSRKETRRSSQDLQRSKLSPRKQTSQDICEDKLSQISTACDNGNSVDPPTKRHCTDVTSKWQPKETLVWKPIPVIDKEHHFNPAFSDHLNCDIFTPPESPVPRPLSASTYPGCYDNMYSPIGASWLEQTTFNKFNAFKNRSLSFEDEISCSNASGSTSSVQLAHHHHHHHHRNKIPRCRSQPSVLYDRKCGIKRRRDYEHRPKLNFHKMTETAYEKFPKSTPVSTLGKEKSRFHEELESVMSLMPIASSPLDNDFPLKAAMESRTSPITEMDHCRSDSTEFIDCENYYDSVVKGPVKLVGEDDEDEEIFKLQEDLDLEQIENH